MTHLEVLLVVLFIFTMCLLEKKWTCYYVSVTSPIYIFVIAESRYYLALTLFYINYTASFKVTVISGLNKNDIVLLCLYSLIMVYTLHFNYS